VAGSSVNQNAPFALSAPVEYPLYFGLNISNLSAVP